MNPWSVTGTVTGVEVGGKKEVCQGGMHGALTSARSQVLGVVQRVKTFYSNLQP